MRPPRARRRSRTANRSASAVSPRPFCASPATASPLNPAAHAKQVDRDSRMTVRLALLYALFAVSGFCGLIYESIWAKYLKLFLGHAAYAQTVVLVVFIGGMAIGAWLCGRLHDPSASADRVCDRRIPRRHLRDQISPVLRDGDDWAYATLLPATCDASGTCIASWIFAAALILPQSILLGTTFPSDDRGMLRAFPDGPGASSRCSISSTASARCLACSRARFVLVPWSGLPGAPHRGL